MYSLTQWISKLSRSFEIHWVKAHLHYIHPRSRSQHPSPSSDAIKISESMFRVYTYPSPCPRFVSHMSVSELVAPCGDFVGRGRPSSSEVVQYACSKPPVHVVAAVWASYQVRKIAGCACAENAGNVFPRRRFRRKPLVNDPGMHHGTCVTHRPWCMSGSLTCGDGENVPGIPVACAPAIVRIWQEAHGTKMSRASDDLGSEPRM